jgi:2'-5' RNA ligase
MPPLRYAVVSYIQDPVGEFVRQMRDTLHPQLRHSAAHVSILPPRLLQGTEAELMQAFRRQCAREQAFAVELGEIDTFVPVTPTVFLRVMRGTESMREVHDRFNAGQLGGREDWPYVPHMTILKTMTFEEVDPARAIAQQQWASFRGSRVGWVRTLTFVRETESQSWVDLATETLAEPVDGE